MTDSYQQESINLAGVVLGGGERNIGFVNLNNGDDETGEIGTLKPFRTIQAFLDAVPDGATDESARNEYVAFIAPGDYDEDLAVDLTNRRIILSSLGVWGLGTFDGPDWGPSGTRRNITVTATGGPVDGIRPGLVITSLVSIGEGMTTHEAYLTKIRISGKIDLTGASGVGSVELTLECEVFGDAGVAIDAGATIIQSYIYRSRMRGTITGANWNLQVSERTRFDGLITISGFSLMLSCRINAGLTTGSVTPVGLIPGGMIGCWFAGTFTGPALSALMDGNTNYWFKTNGAALAGGATKVIADDLVP